MCGRRVQQGGPLCVRQTGVRVNVLIIPFPLKLVCVCAPARVDRIRSDVLFNNDEQLCGGWTGAHVRKCVTCGPVGRGLVHARTRPLSFIASLTSKLLTNVCVPLFTPTHSCSRTNIY
jgi:hypothetical protein